MTTASTLEGGEGRRAWACSDDRMGMGPVELARRWRYDGRMVFVATVEPLSSATAQPDRQGGPARLSRAGSGGCVN